MSISAALSGGFLLAALGAAAVGPPAVGQPACGARESILARLYMSYRERPVARALTATGNVLEVLASDDGETWSIVITSPAGLACLVQSGAAWEPVAPAAPDQRS